LTCEEGKGNCGKSVPSGILKPAGRTLKPYKWMNILVTKRRVDIAIYHAKGEGRSRVMVTE
jgi:hypothetical protein